jgi:hypothetical protein
LHYTSTRCRSRLILALLLAVLTLAAAGPASAVTTALAQDSPPGISMAVEPAFEGLFKYGEWLLLWVELAYEGDTALEAEVQVRVSSGGLATVYATPVTLPPGARKRVPVYVLPNPYSHELEVQLVAGDDLLVMQAVPVNSQPSNHYFVAAAAPSRGAMALLLGISLPGQERPKELVDFTLAELPERPEALASFDCIILNDVDTSSLSPAQVGALQAWVSRGGRLVLGGGAGALRTAAGLPPSMLPLLPSGVVEVDELPGLAAFARAGAIRVPGPFLVADGEAAGGRLLASQALDGDTAGSSLSLIREKTWGSGSVDFVALDLATAPFDAWPGTTDFWQRLLSPGAAFPDWLPRDVSERQMRGSQMAYALSNLPSLDLPSVRGLALVLALYVVMVGPVNYLVLRRQRRLHWAWITIPALTLVFSAGAMGMGYAMRGTDLLLNKVAMVEPRPDGSAAVTSYLGLFSPAQRAYEIEVEKAGLLAPLSQSYDPWGGGPLPSASSGPTVFVQGNPGRVRGLAVNQWSMQTFTTETEWPGFGQITADLRLEDGKLVGSVGNGTSYPLADLVLVAGDEFLPLGDLAAGQSKPVSMGLSDPSSAAFRGEPLVYRLFQPEFQQAGPSGPQRKVELKRTVAQGLLEGGYGKYPLSAQPAAGETALQVMVLGWLDSAPPEVRVNGHPVAEQTTALVYASLPYHLPEAGQVRLPPGLVPGLLVELPQEGGQCGPNGRAVYIGRGQASFEFRVPEELGDLRVTALALMLRSDGGMQQPPDTALYHWADDAWLALEDPVAGTNLIQDVEGLISPEGLVLVQLSSESGGSGGCFYVDLGLEGTR